MYNAAINPTAPSSEYKGDDTTFTLTIAPIRIRIPQQKCPFCASSATADIGKNGLAAPAGEFNEVWMSGGANLLITDAAGKRLGQIGGKLVNEIPGAYFQPIKSGDLYATDDEPVYFVPRGTKFTVTLDGTELKKEALSTVTIIGPGYVFEVGDVVIKPAQKDTIAFSADATEMTYATTSKETPDMVLGTETKGADYEFFVTAQGEANGQEITLKLDAPQGRLGIGTKGLEAKTTYDLKMKRIDDKGEQDFHAPSIDLLPKVTDYVSYAEWTGNHQPVKIGIDKTGDGKVDETITVEDAK